MALGMIFPFIAVWQNQQGLDFAQIGWIFGFGQAVHLLFDPLSSYISDLYSKKLVLITGLVCLLASVLVLAVSSTVGMFIVFTLLYNGGLAFLSGTEESLLHDLWNADQGGFTKWLSNMQIYDEVGTLAGALASSLFILLFNVKVNFVVSATFLSIATLGIFLIHVKKSFFEKDDTGQIFVQSIELARRYRPVYMIVFLGAIAIISFRSEVIYQNALLLVGLSLGTFGVVYALAKLFSIVGSAVAHRVEKKCGAFKAIYLISLVQTVGIALLYCNSVWAAILSLCIFYCAENIFRSIFRAWILNNTPQKIKTVCLSLFNMFSLGIWALLNPLTGLALDRSLMIAVTSLVGLRLLATLSLGRSKNLFIN